jgi:hypothetical protein
VTAGLFAAGPESEPTALPKWVHVIQCLTLECSACNDDLGYDEDEVATSHYSTFKELLEDADRQDWTFPETGPLCRECSDIAAVTIPAGVQPTHRGDDQA